jgi:hypothetical protein
MSIRIIYCSILLLSGQQMVAQTIKLRPALSFSASFNQFKSSTIPEPVFATTAVRSGNASIALDYQRKEYSVYLKFGTYAISNSMRTLNDVKTEFLDFLLASSMLSSSDNMLCLSSGVRKDLMLNNTPKALSLYAGLTFGFQKADTLGTIQSGGPGNFVVADWKVTNFRRSGLGFEIGLTHPFLNKQQKEVLEVSLSYGRFFQAMRETTLFFIYTGPRYGSNQEQKAVFKSYGTSIQITLSKSITLKR